MAELFIKIGTNGPDPLWQDGDVVHCFNNRRIRWQWAEEICRLKHFGFTCDGLRPPSLALKWYQHTHQYQFTRISRNEVERYDTVSGETERFSECPNAKGQYIHLEHYLRRRVAHHNHIIFGVPGREVWYGGRKDFGNLVMDRVWQDIEKDTLLREKNFLDFPLSAREKQIIVAVKIPDIPDAKAELLQSEDRHTIINPDKNIAIDYLIRKRSHQVDYRALSFIELEKVLDLQVHTDYRQYTLPLDIIHHKTQVLAWR